MTPTPTILPDEVLQTDVLGRVRTKRSRREGLLDEFERGGTSAQAFAKAVGVKYRTFAFWVQKRRRARKQYPAASTVKALPSTTTDALRLVEAVVERGEDQVAAITDGQGLCVHLPGGARVEVNDARQAVLGVLLTAYRSLLSRGSRRSAYERAGATDVLSVGLHLFQRQA